MSAPAPDPSEFWQSTPPIASDDDFARALRRTVLAMVHAARASHVASCLSIAEILTALWHPERGVMRHRPHEPEWPERDRFILSKGHAGAALYASLGLAGYLPWNALADYGRAGQSTSGHVSVGTPGVEHSTGSLGHGLSVAAGMALGQRLDDREVRCFVLASEGDLHEGSSWEAINFAAHHRLGNLTLIVDRNRQMSFGRDRDVLNLEPLSDRLQAFGWQTSECDGHDIEALRSCLGPAYDHDSPPHAILADTTKGKGVSFMERRVEWHYGPPNDDELAAALAELQAESGPGANDA